MEGWLYAVSPEIFFFIRKGDDKMTEKRPIDEINEAYNSHVPKNELLNGAYRLVRDFQSRMGQPVADVPTKMDVDRRQNRFEYMDEELLEFFSATDLVDQADAMIDLIYLALGTLVELGVEPDELFRIVHHANMSKLWPDGKPRLDSETGKVVKPPTFVRPEPWLGAEIKRQIDAKK
jgi:predicted HAD superfamily Cof-like phosphohydrolase